MTRRPRPWLWLLAWVFMVLLCRATWAGYVPPTPVPPLEGTWASPFEDHGLYRCSHRETINRIRSYRAPPFIR